MSRQHEFGSIDGLDLFNLAEHNVGRTGVRVRALGAQRGAGLGRVGSGQVQGAAVAVTLVAHN